jgi:tetratricopeptide (TPR) repeat protein
MLLKRSLLTFGVCLGVGVLEGQAQSTLGHTEPEAHFRNGLEYFEKSNYVAARHEFADYLKGQDKLLSSSDYNQVTAEYYIAVTGLYLNYPEAEVQVDRFVKNHAEHPKAQQIFSDLGKFYYEAGEYEKAITYLEKAVQTAPLGKRVENAYRLAMAYYNTKQLDMALPLFNEVKMETSFGNAPDASFYAGVINYGKNNFREAYDDFRRIENHPYYKDEAPNWIVSTLYQLKRYDELLTYGEKLLNQQKGNNKLDDVALYVAEVYYEKGDHKAAVTAYERYKKMKPGTLVPAVALHYGHSLFRTTNYTGAIDAMKTIAVGKDSIAQYASYLVGISHLQGGSLSYALTAFGTAAGLSFNTTVQEEAAFNHAKVQLDLGSSAEAIKELNDFANKYKDSKHDDEVSQLIAEAYSNSKNNAGAISYIEGLKKRTPQINQTYQRLTFNAGVTDFNQESFTTAIANFDKALKYPIDGELNTAATYYKAEALSGLKRESEAATIYNQLTKNPNAGIYGRKSLYALGYLYYNQKNYSKALGYFKDFTANTTGIEHQVVEDAHVRLADCYLAAKNYNEAIRTYDKVTANGKVDKDYALFQKGRSFVYMKREAEAKKSFESLINQYPGSRYVDDAMFQMADMEFQSGAYQEAIRSFTRLINEKPKSYMVPAALLRRGQGYYNIQVYEQAITDFKRILSEYSSSPSATSALEGIQESYNAVGRPEEFSQVLALVRGNNPGNSKLEEVEFDNARNLFYAEKYSQAIPVFESFLSSYPASPHIYDITYFLGGSFEKTGDVARALQYYNRVLKENRSSYVPTAAQRSAELEIGRGNLANAVSNYRILQKNAESKKEQTVAAIGLMDTYYTLKKYDSTLYFAKEVISIGNVVPGGVGRAQLYQGKIPYEKGEYAKATEEFKKVVASSKDEVGAEAKYWLSQILFKTKKYKESEASIFELSKEFEGYDTWRAKSFILLADVYLAMNDVPQAKATLKSIIENADDKDAIEEAKSKLAEIERR